MKTTNVKQFISFFKDSLYSISGLVIANVIAQFIVYPIWAERLGDNKYGDVIFLLSLMNILAIGIGSACNYAVMKQSVKEEARIFHYNIFMLIASLCCIPIYYIFYVFVNPDDNHLNTVLYIMLAIATMWRFYLDVEFRLKTHYQNFFWYYAIIGVGYLIGIFLFVKTGLWMFALLPGEIFGIVFVFFREKIYVRKYIKQTEPFADEIKVILILFSTNLLSQLIFNGDRILLKVFLDSGAVTDYYIASLLGKSLTLITTPLNSVIIGYLVKHNYKFDFKFMNKVTLVTFIVAILAVLLCQGASHILISLLYPQNYESVKIYFWIANAAQIFYFIGNTITVVLLRFCKNSYQLYVNLLYAIVFIVLCVFGVVFGSFTAFCFMVAIASLIRLLYALGLGYFSLFKKEKCKD